MTTLKETLNKSHSSKTKKELVELLSNLQKLISPKEYERVSGLKPTELMSTTKADILEVLEDFRENYKPQWENNISSASRTVLKALFERIDLDEANFRAQAGSAADADFVAQLGNIDFENLIGGPLEAAVKAQANASLSTVNFIQEVGFELDDDDKQVIRTVDFSYIKKTPNPNFGSTDPDLPEGTDTATEIFSENVAIVVPFISILNVPSLRIETVDIDFNVKLNSVFTKNVKSTIGIKTEVKNGGWSPIKFKVSASYRRSSSSGVRVEKQYTMGVKVKATNDEMPAGLEKVLNLLAA